MIPAGPAIHAFLSHSSRDKPIVKQIGTALEKDHQLDVWLDEWDLVGGDPWQEKIEDALLRSRAVVVFVGPLGLGNWEKPEVRVALDRQVQKKCRVIPVLLPGVRADTGALPPFLAQYHAIIFRSATDPEALAKLVAALTDQPRHRLAAAPTRVVASKDPIDKAIEYLKSSVKTGNVSFLVGSGMVSPGAQAPPCAFEITQSLLEALELLQPGAGNALATLDTAASYFEVRSGVGQLEETVVELMRARGTGVSDTHSTLAALIGRLARRPQGRMRNKHPQLIVTSNLDLLIERELLRHGVSFTRVVQYVPTMRIDINRYELVVIDGGAIEVRTGDMTSRASLADTEQLDELIGNHGHEAIERRDRREDVASDRNDLKELVIKPPTSNAPVLYKCRGSQDLPRSCGLSASQYFEFLHRVATQQIIPDAITGILGNTPNVMLGYGFLEPEFRLLYHTLLRRSENSIDKHFMVRAAPQGDDPDTHRRFESTVWADLKEAGQRNTGITTIEAAPAAFLDRFLAELP